MARAKTAKTQEGERVLSGVIKAVREARKLTQEELGARCSPPRTQGAVGQWERGDHPLSEATLDVVAVALGISVEELLLEGLREMRKARGAAS